MNNKMAGRTLPINRSRTSLDQERENFERNQMVAINKAVSSVEAPVKAKHVRSAIIGTFQAKGSHVFWSIIVRLPVHSDPIVAWKFCHTLHKVLREGHPNVLRDSQQHREFIVDKGKLWGLYKDGYGKLIYLYCHLLVVKLDFHRKNPRFPGSLIIKDESIEDICDHDINSYFQLSVELLDYMDEVLVLQAAIFGSLDMSRSNSMTNAGQCRLAPLIPCIQDSSQVYDFIVKLLFKLHNCLPPETLEGHRIRFLKQFKSLRQFYLQSSTLQYFKTLIQVPYLDENPPNFLISSEISRHVTPVVILPNEVTPPLVDDTLVQLESEASEGNGSSSASLLLERDRYIEHLLHQLEQLSSDLQKFRIECNQEIGDLRQEILDLEMRLSDKETEVEEALREKEDIERKLGEAAESAQTSEVVRLQLDEMGKRAKGWEEKFSKLKDVYQKLRDEHIKLLRQKGEVDKKLSLANASIEESNKIQNELQDSLELVKASLKNAESEIQILKSEKNEELHKIQEERTILQEAHDKLILTSSVAQGKIETIQDELAHVGKEKDELSSEVEKLRILLDTNLLESQELKQKLEKFQEKANKTESDFEEFKVTREAIIMECEREKNELSYSKSELEKRYDDMTKRCITIEEQVRNLMDDKEKIESSSTLLEEELVQAKKNSEELHSLIKKMKDTNEENAAEHESYRKSKETTIENLNREKEEFQAIVSGLKAHLNDLEDQMRVNMEQKNSLERNVQELLTAITSKTDHYESLLSTRTQGFLKLLQDLLIHCCFQSENFLAKCVSNLPKPPIASSLQDQSGFDAQEIFVALKDLKEALSAYISEGYSGKSICRAIPLLFPFAQSIGYFLLNGQLLAQSLSDIDKADELIKKCVLAGQSGVTFFKLLQTPFLLETIEANSELVKATFTNLENFINEVMDTLKAKADQANVGEQLENELGEMERAIEEAAMKIAKLWDSSKHSQLTGVKLEVNEKVLDSCTNLMKAIVDLIRKAKVLQEEIVARGKGTASAREFYKRNHQWTEGLLSAAKTVGFGAKLLTDAADNVVKGQAKFEQLTVASQEIAASTAQLVYASRVKAEHQSKNLQALAESSKAVSLATGGVVAAAKHCAELVEDSSVLDFAHLSLHQAKRLEMESQVKLLELESSLERERMRLSALRKQRYQLAGESDA